MNTIPIRTPADFECVCCDLLNDFVESYTHENGCLINDVYEDGADLFSPKGLDLYERYQLRLFAIGQRLFPGADMTIEASFMEEPGEDYNEHPDFELCPSCGGRSGYHKSGCQEDDAIWY
jgi:hypothetical protein